MILLDRARTGDLEAQDELYRRVLPRLERFVHGRLPLSMRRLSDTQEIVQETVLRSLRHLHSFKPRGEGAFMHYLGTIVLNQIRDLARRPRREVALPDEDTIAGREPCPVEEAVGRETFRLYQEALDSLREDQRTAVILHVEMGYSNQELAEALGRSPEAARKFLVRSLEAVAAKMKLKRRG